MIFQLLLASFLVLSLNIFAKNSLDDYYQLEREEGKLNARYSEIETQLKQQNNLNLENRKKLKSESDEIVDKYIALSKRMKKLEEVLTVKAWSQKLKNLEKINTRFKGDVVQNRVCDQNGEYQFFIDNKSFEKWNDKNGNIDKKIEFYASKNNYIANCLSTKSEGSKANVDSTYYSMCKRILGFIGKYQSTSYKYQLEKKNVQITISSKIFVTYRGKKERAAESIFLLYNAVPCMEDFYARHGMKLDLKFEIVTPNTKMSSSDVGISLHDEYERANAYNWVTHKMDKHELHSFERCSLYLHELGHLFGLTDSYPDPDCPDREVIRPIDDIMNEGLHGADEVKFYEADLNKLLKPLCEN